MDFNKNKPFGLGIFPVEGYFLLRMAKLPVCVSGPVRIAGQHLDEIYFSLTQIEIGGKTSVFAGGCRAAFKWAPQQRHRWPGGNGCFFLGSDLVGRSFVSSDLSHWLRTIEPPSLGPHCCDIHPCRGFRASFSHHYSRAAEIFSRSLSYFFFLQSYKI